MLPLGAVVLTTVSVLSGVVKQFTPTTMDVTHISASLRSLISGNVGVEVLDQDDDVIGTLSLGTADANGDPVFAAIDPPHNVPAGGWVTFNVTGVGVGAGNLYATVWAVSS